MALTVSQLDIARTGITAAQLQLRIEVNAAVTRSVTRISSLLETLSADSRESIRREAHLDMFDATAATLREAVSEREAKPIIRKSR